MPIVLRIGPYTFGFYAADEDEPPHVHARRGSDKAKIWIEPDVRMARSRGFADHEITELLKMVAENREFLLEQWHDFFNQ